MAPPNGFIQAGRLYASWNDHNPNDSKTNQSVDLPEGTVLDLTYQQTGPLTTSGGGADSPLAAGNISPGFYVECGGTVDNGKRWAVLAPYNNVQILTGSDFGPGMVPRKITFTLGLYTDCGNNLGVGGSNTWVNVWYKTA